MIPPSYPDDPLPWQTEGSDYVYRERWLTVRKDAVRLAKGGYMPDYYLFEYTDWINVVAVTTAGQLVLIRIYRHGVGQTLFELCAGAVDPPPPGVDPRSEAYLLATAQRELLEETGFGGGTWQLFMTASANTGTHTNLNYTFLAIDVDRVQAQDLEDTEEITVHLVSPAEAWEIINSGQMKQAICLAPLLKYLATMPRSALSGNSQQQ
ncbi:NUDIX hydrolase [Fibrella sp. HMF5335]|uniref:GDP-mannose pyrophosphatase n=1 Tax=Fibrella rubiginis TaxID=2817060 RepID=A0A939GGN3_9BACT|nr:NUDIX hydrolase [Fibrella rubiginis]MBO0936108.1 NUDIX hydrolase [Fibrella rubiginis]